MRMNKDTTTDTLATLKGSTTNLFATRDTIQDAMDYANELAKAEGFPELYMTTAIMIYHNTLVKVIIEDMEAPE